MSILSNLSLLILVLTIALLMPVFAYPHMKKNDDLCPRLSTVYCLRDVLMTIRNSANEINDIAHLIKEHIERDSNQDSLNDYAISKMKDIRTILPPSDYHFQLMNINNNINITGLLDLTKEEYYAYGFLYNSIENILKLDNFFAKSVHKLFLKMLHHIQKDILCNYRNIFHTYSHKFLALDDITRMYISEADKHHAPSFIHNTHSLIVIRLLDEWKKNINHLVNNIAFKLAR